VISLRNILHRHLHTYIIYIYIIMKYNFIQFTNTTVCRLCRDKQVFWKNILIGLFASVRSCGSMRARRRGTVHRWYCISRSRQLYGGDRPAATVRLRYLDVILCACYAEKICQDLYIYIYIHIYVCVCAYVWTMQV